MARGAAWAAGASAWSADSGKRGTDHGEPAALAGEAVLALAAELVDPPVKPVAAASSARSVTG